MSDEEADGYEKKLKTMKELLGALTGVNVGQVTRQTRLERRVLSVRKF